MILNISIALQLAYICECFPINTVVPFIAESTGNKEFNILTLT